MPRQLTTVHCLLITCFLLSSCQATQTTATPTRPPQTSLLVYRFDPPAFIEYSADLERVKEIPFSIPLSCGLNNTFAAPIGPYVVIELNCPNGQTVLFLDASSSLSAGSASITQPVTDSDSHFLAWTSDGSAAYLKVDLLGNPLVIRAYPNGESDRLGFDEFTYDLSARPDSSDFIFASSRGMGQGSELWLAQNNAQSAHQLYSDLHHYISFARFSPDGKQIVFIKIPDTQTPFTVGELWLMNSDGTNVQKVADADAGHGYAANWSPDGKQIAFVVRENADDERANQVSEALISNIYIVDVQNSELTQVTQFAEGREGRAETPFWSPDGNTLAFQVVINGRMNVFIADVATGEIQPLKTESVCCPAWMRK